MFQPFPPLDGEVRDLLPSSRVYFVGKEGAFTPVAGLGADGVFVFFPSPIMYVSSQSNNFRYSNHKTDYYAKNGTIKTNH